MIYIYVLYTVYIEMNGNGLKKKKNYSTLWRNKEEDIHQYTDVGKLYRT